LAQTLVILEALFPVNLLSCIAEKHRRKGREQVTDGRDTVLLVESNARLIESAPE